MPSGGGLDRGSRAFAREGWTEIVDPGRAWCGFWGAGPEVPGGSVAWIARGSYTFGSAG